jgi:tetratricopeptide (TPR) repeat protein
VTVSAAGAGLTLVLAAALAATAFGAKGGLELERTTTTEIALTLGGAAVVALAALISPIPRRAWGTGSSLLLAALALLTGLSIVWSINPSQSWLDTDRMVSFIAAFGAGVAIARLVPWRWTSVVYAVPLACVVVCGYALATKVFPASLNPDELYARLREPFGYWNAVGVMGALSVPPLLWLGARREGHRYARALAYPALGLVLVCVMLAFSRGALLAIAVGCAFWFATVPLRLRGSLVLATGALGALAVTAWAFSQDALTKDRIPLDERTHAGHEFGLLLVLLALGLYGAGLAINALAASWPLPEATRRRTGLALIGTVVVVPLVALLVLAFNGNLSHGWNQLTNANAKPPGNTPGRLTAAASVRARYWRDARRIFERHVLLGAGAGAYVTARQQVRRDLLEVRHAHGFLPQTVADLGLLGLGLSLALLAAWLAAAVRATGLRKQDRGQPFTQQRIGLLTLAAVVLVFGVHSLVDWTWFVPGTAVLALFCAGFLAGRGPLFGEPVSPSRRLPLGARAGAAAATVGVALIAAWMIWQPQRSASATAAAITALGKDHVDSAYADVAKAKNRNPLAVEPLLAQAAIEQSVGRYPAARRALERAVRLQPANAETWRRLGEFDLQVLNQPRPALDELRAALYLDPQSSLIRQQFVAASRLLAQGTAPPAPASTTAAPATPAPAGGTPAPTTKPAAPAAPARKPAAPTATGRPPARRATPPATIGLGEGRR